MWVVYVLGPYSHKQILFGPGFLWSFYIIFSSFFWSELYAIIIAAPVQIFRLFVSMRECLLTVELQEFAPWWTSYGCSFSLFIYVIFRGIYIFLNVLLKKVLMYLFFSPVMGSRDVHSDDTIFVLEERKVEELGLYKVGFWSCLSFLPHFISFLMAKRLLLSSMKISTNPLPSKLPEVPPPILHLTLWKAHRKLPVNSICDTTMQPSSADPKFPLVNFPYINCTSQDLIKYNCKRAIALQSWSNS